MTLTRLPGWILMPEITDPGNAPADYAWLFARDDGVGATKVSYHTSAGPLVDVDTPPIGPGSGGEFINVERDYGVDGSGNDYAGMTAALADAKSGDTVWCPLPSIQINTGLLVPPGVHLLGMRLAGENAYARLYAGAAMTNLVTLSDGASVSGFTLDGNSQADVAGYSDGYGATIAYCKPLGGKTHSMRNNSSGADRTTFSHNRCENGGSVAVIGIYGKQNTVDSNVATGVQAGAVATLAACDESSFNVGHYTGNSGSSEALRVTGDFNSFSSVVGDTCGGPAEAMLSIRGNCNTFFDCGMMNIANGLTRPMIAIRPSVGNQLYGFFYTRGGQTTGNCQLAVQFLDASGSPLANTSGNRALFKGTRVYWSASNLSASGGEFSNFTPASGDAIDLVGSNGSAAQNYRT